MQFKHPEFLYALLLLVIPIVIHLFQLRRFKREAFTNVTFLKKVELQTRQSAQLKKWLLLLTRLLTLMAVVMAFAQPFIPRHFEALSQKEILLYVDNSLSMQQPGDRGTLLEEATQEILQNWPSNQSVSLLTNTGLYRNLSYADLKEKLLRLQFNPVSLSLKTVLLKAEQVFSSRNTSKLLIAVSDFQQKDSDDAQNLTPQFEVNLIQLQGHNITNFSIDSVYLDASQSDDSHLNVELSASKPVTKNISVALYNGKKLLAKSSAEFKNTTAAKLQFSVPQNIENWDGKLRIEDASVKFDNRFYFTHHSDLPVQVTSIESTSSNPFLSRIYTESSGFIYIRQAASQLDFSKLSQAHLIVLNELPELSNSLIDFLINFVNQGRQLVIIPSENPDLSTYNKLLTQLSIGQLQAYKKVSLKVSQINFDHPVYKAVFTQRITNFQYPEVTGYFPFKGKATPLLSYNNAARFLIQGGNCFLFTASLSSEGSNFIHSPLIVPTFYNIGKNSLPQPTLYTDISHTAVVNLQLQTQGDQVVGLKLGNQVVIPRQEQKKQGVSLYLGGLTLQAGTYQVRIGEEPKGKLSLNANRIEHQMKFADLSQLHYAEVSHNINQFFEAEINQNEDDNLWKWFVIFALIFLVTEVCITKYLK